MKKNFFGKCFITLGLLLFFTVLIPFIPFRTATVKASEIGKEKSEASRLNLTSVILAKGKSIALKTYNVGNNAKISFKSDDQEIASVSDSGFITANKVGSTVITVIIKDGANTTSLTCDVTVGPSAISVKWTQSRIIIGIEDTYSLNVILKPSNTAEDAVFESENTSIVTVSPGGRITAKAYGLTKVNAYIDATEADGSKKRDTCIVIVTTKDSVSKLEDYYKTSSELGKISQSDLDNALSKFFNENLDPKKIDSLDSNLDKFLKETFN